MRNLNRGAVALALVGALALAGCGSREEEAPVNVVQDNFVTEVPADEGAPMNVEEPTPVAEPTNVATKAAPPPAFTDKQQISDDADATGMTARIQSDDAPRPAANETAPAE